MQLKNKVAIVTGSAGGIGYGIAEKYAKNGATVVIADVAYDKAQITAQKLQSEYNVKAHAVNMDVSNEDSVNASVNETIKLFGKVDILVSNAGIQHIDSIVDLSLQNWQKIIDIHLTGAFLTTKACLLNMYKNNSGCIIYIGSAHSKVASPLKAPYVSAKHGLIGLCRVVAKEAAQHNVRANVICPGFVKTPLVEKQIPEQAKNLGISEEEVVKKVMLGNTVDSEFTTIEDVAETALYFATFNSNALTGQSLLVSHGWCME